MIAKHLVPQLPQRPIAWEPFCGGLNVTRRLVERFPYVIASDVSVPLISLFQAVRAGWDPPSEISREEYAAARVLPETNPLHGFCAFPCSFSGKRWGGRSRDLKRGRNYVAEGRRAILRDAPLPQELHCAAFTDVPIDPVIAPRLLIYCDPPYEGTAGYGFAFDHAAFWDQCRAWARVGACVRVSEYQAPADFETTWERERYGGLSNRATERLYKLQGAP